MLPQRAMQRSDGRHPNRLVKVKLPLVVTGHDNGVNEIDEVVLL